MTNEYDEEVKPPTDVRDRPKRRIQVTLDLHADSWDEVARALGDIQHRVYEQEARDPDSSIRCTSGGCGSGYHIEAIVNTAQTAQGYREDLLAYMADPPCGLGKSGHAS